MTRLLSLILVVSAIILPGIDTAGAGLHSPRGWHDPRSLPKFCTVSHPTAISIESILQLEPRPWWDPPPFTSCIQDGSNGAILQLNSTTGDYLFTNCLGVTISGTGTLIKRGSMLTLQDLRTDRRVLAKVDGSARQGIASVQLFSPSGTFTIIDRNISDIPAPVSECLRNKIEN